MAVSVLIPTWRRPAELSRCLAALAAQTRTPDEVIVVARSEDRETWELLERDVSGAPVRGLAVAEAGVVPSLNGGIVEASGEIVAITDDDAAPRPDWLERIERALLADPSVGGVGGRDWVHHGDEVLDGEEAVVGKVRWFGSVVGNHHLGAGPARDVDLLKGANMAFRAQALRGVTIDEGLRGSGAQVHWEIDLCLAVQQAGWRLVYDPEIAVDHFPAQRFDEDQRTGRPVAALENEVYNETYLLLKRLPAWRGVLVLGYGLLVGTRLAPGLVTAVERRIRGEHPGARLAASQRARMHAFRARRARKGTNRSYVR
jgi:GT2 family glycosyltransferase